MAPPPDAASQLRIVVVVGNPKPKSRTRALAETAASAVAAAAGQPDTVTDVIDIADFGSALFAYGDVDVAAALERMYAADIVVIASPTYKASYTGLLKVFCDLVPAGRLAGIAVVPVMTAGAPEHRLAAETHLRPLLAELGAVQAAPVLFALEADLGDIDAVVAGWASTVSWRHLLAR